MTKKAFTKCSGNDVTYIVVTGMDVTRALLESIQQNTNRKSSCFLRGASSLAWLDLQRESAASTPNLGCRLGVEAVLRLLYIC